MFVETKKDGEAQIAAMQRGPSIDGFIAWLETMPSWRSYDYTDHEKCALGQYYASIGGCPRTHAREVFPNIEDQHDLLCAEGSMDTFGRALERVRTWCSKQSTAE